MSLFLNNETNDNAELISSRVGRLESDEAAERPTVSDALFPENDDDDADGEYAEETAADEDDSTDESDLGDNDHHQDDNYALGGHVTRSGSV